MRLTLNPRSMETVKPYDFLRAVPREVLLATIAQQQAAILPSCRLQLRHSRRSSPSLVRSGLRPWKERPSPVVPGECLVSSPKPTGSRPSPDLPNCRCLGATVSPASAVTPTRRELEHALDSLANQECRAPDWRAAGRSVTREVIDILGGSRPTLPPSIVALIARICPELCEQIAEDTPGEDLAGVALGKSNRLGINLVRSGLPHLREEARLPYRTIQWYLQTVHQAVPERRRTTGTGSSIGWLRLGPGIRTGEHPGADSGQSSGDYDRRDRPGEENLVAQRQYDLDLLHSAPNGTSCAGGGIKEVDGRGAGRREVRYGISWSADFYASPTITTTSPIAALLGPPAAGDP